jgi:plastocyanin
MSRAPLTRRRALVRGVTAAVVGTSAGCAGGTASSDRRTVTMTDELRFDPETTRIEPGTTVTWENTSEANHTVTATGESVPADAAYFASGGFASERAARDHGNDGLVEPAGTYSHAFAVPGSYDYVCLPHERSGMTGSVVVATPEESG